MFHLFKVIIGGNVIRTNPTLWPGGTQQLPALVVAPTSQDTLTTNKETIVTNPFVWPVVITIITILGLSTGFLFGDLQKGKKHRN